MSRLQHVVLLLLACLTTAMGVEERTVWPRPRRQFPQGPGDWVPLTQPCPTCRPLTDPADTRGSSDDIGLVPPRPPPTSRQVHGTGNFFNQPLLQNHPQFSQRPFPDFFPFNQQSLSHYQQFFPPQPQQQHPQSSIQNPFLAQTYLNNHQLLLNNNPQLLPLVNNPQLILNQQKLQQQQQQQQQNQNFGGSSGEKKEEGNRIRFRPDQQKASQNIPQNIRLEQQNSGVPPTRLELPHNAPPGQFLQQQRSPFPLLQQLQLPPGHHHPEQQPILQVNPSDPFLTPPPYRNDTNIQIPGLDKEEIQLLYVPVETLRQRGQIQGHTIDDQTAFQQFIQPPSGHFITQPPSANLPQQQLQQQLIATPPPVLTQSLPLHDPPQQFATDRPTVPPTTEQVITIQPRPVSTVRLPSESPRFTARPSTRPVELTRTTLPTTGTTFLSSQRNQATDTLRNEITTTFQQSSPAPEEFQRLQNPPQRHRFTASPRPIIEAATEIPLATTTLQPHQPPLSVYMVPIGGDVKIVDVLRALKGAPTIPVLDNFTQDSPQVFVGPANLNLPAGFGKFELPYLSNLEQSRVERNLNIPFFVAPLNFVPPHGYSKIPFPAPHVGSVVVSNESGMLREVLLEKGTTSEPLYEPEVTTSLPETTTAIRPRGRRPTSNRSRKPVSNSRLRVTTPPQDEDTTPPIHENQVSTQDFLREPQEDRKKTPPRRQRYRTTTEPIQQETIVTEAPAAANTFVPQEPPVEATRQEPQINEAQPPTFEEEQYGFTLPSSQLTQPRFPAADFNQPEAPALDFVHPKFPAADFQQPEVRQPSFPAGNFEQPEIRQPGFASTDFQPPSSRQPEIRQPGFASTDFQAPTSRQPENRQPGFPSTEFQPPASRQPAFPTTEFQQPETRQPTFTTDFRPPQFEPDFRTQQQFPEFSPPSFPSTEFSPPPPPTRRPHVTQRPVTTQHPKFQQPISMEEIQGLFEVPPEQPSQELPQVENNGNSGLQTPHSQQVISTEQPISSTQFFDSQSPSEETVYQTETTRRPSTTSSTTTTTTTPAPLEEEKEPEIEEVLKPVDVPKKSSRFSYPSVPGVKSYPNPGSVKARGQIRSRPRGTPTYSTTSSTPTADESSSVEPSAAAEDVTSSTAADRTTSKYLSHFNRSRKPLRPTTSRPETTTSGPTRSYTVRPHRRSTMRTSVATKRIRKPTTPSPFDSEDEEPLTDFAKKPRPGFAPSGVSNEVYDDQPVQIAPKPKARKPYYHKKTTVEVDDHITSSSPSPSTKTYQERKDEAHLMEFKTDEKEKEFPEWNPSESGADITDVHFTTLPPSGPSSPSDLTSLTSPSGPSGPSSPSAPSASDNLDDDKKNTISAKRRISEKGRRRLRVRVQKRPHDNFETAESQNHGTVNNVLVPPTPAKPSAPDLYRFSSSGEFDFESSGKFIGTQLKGRVRNITADILENTSTFSSPGVDTGVQRVTIASEPTTTTSSTTTQFDEAAEKSLEESATVPAEKTTEPKKESPETTTVFHYTTNFVPEDITTEASFTTTEPSEDIGTTTYIEVPSSSVQPPAREQGKRKFPKVIRTSTTTQVSHETEICYKGKCIKTNSDNPDQALKRLVDSANSEELLKTRT